MTSDDIFKIVQKYIENVPLLLIGSGSSAAHKMPGMQELSTQLQATIGVEYAADSEWIKVKDNLLKGEGLEGALTDIHLNRDILNAIRCETWNYLSKTDLELLQRLIFRSEEFPLSMLLKKITRANAPLNIITTNYDRIIEYACDNAEISVNTGFCGNYKRIYNDSFPSGNNVNLVKVHGSLDTFIDVHGVSVSVPLLDKIPCGLIPEIITPGDSKYEAVLEGTPRRLLYWADSFIKSAQSFLCIGYGFNDRQIQENIVSRIRGDHPLVLISRSVSDKTAHLLCENAKHYVSIQKGEADNTTVFCVDREIITLEGTFWTIDGFMRIID